MSYYLTDGSHCLISGATGAGDDYGGKSVLANWWFSESVRRGWHDVGVFYNPKGLGYARGRRVRSLRVLADHFRSGERLFDFYPHDVEEDHAAVMEFLRMVSGRKIVVHDEAQSYQGDALDWSLAQAGNMSQSAEKTGDIRSLVVTQRPWNLSEENRANMPLKIWVGPVGNEAEHFFRAEQMGRALDKVAERTGLYHWSVTDAGEFVETNAPVSEKYANDGGKG